MAAQERGPSWLVDTEGFGGWCCCRSVNMMVQPWIFKNGEWTQGVIVSTDTSLARTPKSDRKKKYKEMYCRCWITERWQTDPTAAVNQVLRPGLRCSASTGQCLSLACPQACISHASKLKNFFSFNNAPDNSSLKSLLVLFRQDLHAWLGKKILSSLHFAGHRVNKFPWKPCVHQPWAKAGDFLCASRWPLEPSDGHIHHPDELSSGKAYFEFVQTSMSYLRTIKYFTFHMDHLGILNDTIS